MAQYRYDGLDPETGPDGTLARPGDVRDFDTGPCWGAWTPLEATESDTAGPPSQPPAPDAEDASAAATGTDG